MAVEWLAAALLTYRHRDDIRHMLTGGLALLFGRKTSIAFTGMQGVGKTVLLDHLTGKGFEPGYQLPLQSHALEKGKIKGGGQKILVSVVPGQDATPRHLALDKLFAAKQPVDGVVHVVANGFASLRSQAAIQSLIQDHKVTTIKKFCEYQLSKELEDLESTCQVIRESHKKKHAPKWLIAAVGKVDLFQDGMGKAQRYYSPDGDSPFAERLRKLASQVGTDFFRWEAVPVCAWVERFEWNKKTIEPQIDLQGRDAYLAQFLRGLRNYCTN